MTDIPLVQNFTELLQQNLVAIGPQLQLVCWGLGILFADFLLPNELVEMNLGGRLVRFHGKALAAVFALLGLGMASIHLYTLWGAGVGPAFFGMVTLDSFTLYFSMLFLASAILAVIISYRYLEIEGEQHAEYYALILFATAGMMFMAAAVDLVTIFVSLELMSLSIYILVGFLRHQRRSNEAAMKYFLLGAFSAAIMLYGMSMLYGLTGSTNLNEIAEKMAGLSNNGLVLIAIFTISAGLCFKIAAAPFHMWAPDAYEGAPSAVTGFMSVAVKAAAFAVFFRIFMTVFTQQRAIYVPILVIIAMLTMTWGNLSALTQQNVKRLLAYSSVSHAGFVLMGLVVGTEAGIMASAVYLLVYTFMNLGVWTVVVMLRRRDIAGDQIEDFNGLYFSRPWIAFLMLLFLLSLAGIPPLAGFFAKYSVFAAVIGAASGPFANWMIALAIVGVLNAVISLYYYFRVVVAMFMRQDYVAVPLGFSYGVTAALIVTGGLTVAIGVYPEPFVRLARMVTVLM